MASPPEYEALLTEIGSDGLLWAISAPEDPRIASEYLHWDKLRRLDPPPGLTSEEWWLKIKLNRNGGRRPLPLEMVDGRPTSYTLPDAILRRLHYIDQHCSGEIAMEEVVVTGDDQARRHYLVNSLMEEAIRSSQLEGATTSRRMAKDLLQSGREPRDRSERMILNNYRALQFMREEIGDHLSPDAVLELQRILTEGTLDKPAAAGRLQRPDEERIAVFDRGDGRVLHRPPLATELPDRLKRMCEFANGDVQGDAFVHPVVRAIVVHFWLGHDHPFEDGNGRTARALFYWCMRTRGYWLTEYLSISRILRNAPSKYTRSYLLTETDEGDVTYFLAYQLEVIERAIEELHSYLRRKMSEIRAIERMLRSTDGLNHRQLALLSHALRHGQFTYTFSGHAGSHGVTHETARTDLSDLSARGLLERRRAGRRHLFTVPPDLAGRLKGLG